jgi:hypothetical protein
MSLGGKLKSFASIASSSLPKSARIYIIPLNSADDTVDDGGIRAFQYFPESVHDNKVTNWQVKDIPGLSHPLYQWTSSGAREISFQVVFTRDLALSQQEYDTFQQRTKLYFAALDRSLQGSISADPRNTDIPSAIAWLRQFKYPEYQQDASMFPSPPRKMILGIPGLRLNHGNTGLCPDEIYCIMLNCEVSYEAFFGDGTPRYAVVQLSFAEIIQVLGGVRVIGASDVRNIGLSGYKLMDTGTVKGPRRSI